MKEVLEIQLELPAHGRAEAVVELTKVRAGNVVLNVARIEMVRDVENDDAGARLLVQERNFETLQHCRIKRQEHREARAIPSADKIQTVVDYRVRETRTHFESRHDRDGPLGLHFTVTQEAMWNIEWQRAELVCSYDERRKISEKIVRSVEASLRARPHIRKVPIMQART